jgi:hypothetical protein
MATATNTGTAATTNGGDPLIVPSDSASTNVYWTFSGKESKEVFNLQTTLRGNLSKKQIEEHVKSVLAGMGVILSIGGHAKPVGQQPASEAASNGAAASGKQPEWKTIKGKLTLVTHGSEPPKKIDCPLHKGEAMKYGKGDYGNNYFHRHDDEFCRANVVEEVEA